MGRFPDGCLSVQKRLVLGFDGGCEACSELAQKIEQLNAGKLEVLSLHDPLLRGWRAKTLAKDAPLSPTLFEVEGDRVQAWTGWRLAVALNRSLGAASTWRIMQIVGEMSTVPRVEESALVDKLPERAAETVLGLTRGQFLKGLGGGAVAMSVLSGTSGIILPARAAPANWASVERSVEASVGASVVHPSAWSVDLEDVRLRNTRGFTLWRSVLGADSQQHDCHGGVPTIRIAVAEDLRPGQVEGRVRSRLSEYAHLSPRREKVSVGTAKLKGVAVGPIPGGTPSTEVYVTVDDLVYQVNVYGERLGAEGRRLLSSLRFDAPSRTARSAHLPDGGDPQTFYRPDDEGALQEQSAREDAARSAPPERSASALPNYGERRIAEGCWQAPSRFFVQTQHSWFANKLANDPGTDAPTGFTKIGQPNFWGQYTHGNLGWGRCNRAGYTNDKFAVDYPYNRGDRIYSPFKSGVVVFAGRNYTHRHYGIFVVIKSEGGKYVSLSAHLSALGRGIRKGARVTDASTIGFAGDSGHPSIPVGEVHLHQAFYRYPRYNSDGSPYGGAGLKVVYHHYLGKPGVRRGGVYEFVNRGTRQTARDQKTEGEFISN